MASWVLLDIRLISTVHYRCDWLLSRLCLGSPRPLTTPAHMFGWVHGTGSACKRGSKPSLFRLVLLHAERTRHARFSRDRLTRARCSGTRQPIMPYIFPSYISLTRHVNNLSPPISLPIAVLLNSPYTPLQK